MALADHARRLRLFPPLPYTLSVPACLAATALLALLAGPIPLGRQPPRPEAGGCHTGCATVPRKRMRRRKPLLAPLQQTNPRPSVGRSLRLCRKAIMLDHGPRERQLPKVKSRQRSFLSAPGRLPFGTSCSATSPGSSLITPLATLHLLQCLLHHLVPSPRDPPARGPAHRRREFGTLSCRD